MAGFPADYRIGSYRIIRLLGEGGMGAVYEAVQEPLSRLVAIKILHAEYAAQEDIAARFFNEAKILSRLVHPSLVQVSDFGQTPDGSGFLVMEYLRGQTLGSRLQLGDGRIPLVTALQLCWQIADVLIVAHAEGVVHRDIKPDNLMLVADPIAANGERVKLLDFGIAKLLRESDRSGAKTNTTAVLGTPMYMSPEQCAGAGGVDAQADVYALGCVLYHMLAGRPPFVADGGGQLIGMHLFQIPPALTKFAPKTPAAVVSLVERMLRKDKLQRASMTKVADQLGALLAELTGTPVAVRSRRPVDSAHAASADGASSAGPSTTLGHSLGQQTYQRGRTLRRAALGFGLAVALVIGVAATRHSHQKPLTVLPIVPPSMIETAVPRPVSAPPVPTVPAATAPPPTSLVAEPSAGTGVAATTLPAGRSAADSRLRKSSSAGSTDRQRQQKVPRTAAPPAAHKVSRDPFRPTD